MKKLIILSLLWISATSQVVRANSDVSNAPASISEYQNDYNFSLRGGEATLESIKNGASEMFIPSEVVIDDVAYPVTVIGESAFSFRLVRAIHIPSTVRKIGSHAFEGTNIERLYIESIESWYEIDFEQFFAGYNEGYRSEANPMREDTELYIGGELFDGNLVIPDSITSLSPYVFYRFGGITYLTVNGNIKTLHDTLFTGCVNLKSVVLEEGVEEIGLLPFGGCTSLEEITLPSTLKGIDWWGFGTIPLKRLNIPSLEWWLSIDTPENLTYMNTDPDYMLYVEGQPLRDVVIPEKIDNIRANAFALSGVQSVSIHEGVTAIGSFAFGNCHSLTSVEIPGTVREIDGKAFINSGLKSITLNEGIVSIGVEAFRNCGLESIKFPSTMRGIAVGMLQDCSSLREVVLPEGIVYLGFHILESCSSLESLSIPASVRDFRCSLIGCSGLKQIIMNPTEIPETPEYFPESPYFNNWGIWEPLLSQCTLYVPAESLELYREDPVWGQFLTILPIDVETGIGNVSISETENSQPIIYDLYGRRVNHNDLKPGIYIINGKKTVITR